MSGPQVWQVVFTVEGRAVPVTDAVLEEAGAISVASFGVDPDAAWTVTALFEGPPPAGLGEALGAALGETPRLETGPVEDKDWIAETVRAFPPLAIGPFWVHGSHAAPPDGTRMPLLIDAGIAFGSGEHATTEGCLLALAALRDEGVTPGNALDMGCGSGILAIGAAKLFGCPVLAIDIDPASALFAAEAAAANRCAGLVTALAGDGYATPAVAELGPFDLVMANILANPLIAMAPALAAAMAPGGRAILSGLLAEQADSVIAAHEAAGFALARREDLRGWSTLTITKRG